jgi:hypothetical protein
MTEELYAEWTCKKCATKHGGRWSPSGASRYHYGICDLCNEWVPVTQPKDFNNKKLIANRNYNKILDQLINTMIVCLKSKDYYLISNINYQIDEVVYEMLESESSAEVP